MDNIIRINLAFSKIIIGKIVWLTRICWKPQNWHRYMFDYGWIIRRYILQVYTVKWISLSSILWILVIHPDSVRVYKLLWTKTKNWNMLLSTKDDIPDQQLSTESQSEALPQFSWLRAPANNIIKLISLLEAYGARLAFS